jgi:hypothetical protein
MGGRWADGARSPPTTSNRALVEASKLGFGFQAFGVLGSFFVCRPTFDSQWTGALVTSSKAQKGFRLGRTGLRAAVTGGQATQRHSSHPWGQRMGCRRWQRNGEEEEDGKMSLNGPEVSLTCFQE